MPLLVAGIEMAIVVGEVVSCRNANCKPMKILMFIIVSLTVIIKKKLTRPLGTFFLF